MSRVFIFFFIIRIKVSQSPAGNVSIVSPICANEQRRKIDPFAGKWLLIRNERRRSKLKNIVHAFVDHYSRDKYELTALHYSICGPQQKQLHIAARMNGQCPRIMNILREHQRGKVSLSHIDTRDEYMPHSCGFVDNDWKPIPTRGTYTFIIMRFQRQMLYRFCQTKPMLVVAL